MFRTLRRWKTNIAWLLNRPAKMTETKGEDCSYCGEKALLVFDVFAICAACLKKALDKALKEAK